MAANINAALGIRKRIPVRKRLDDALDGITRAARGDEVSDLFLANDQENRFVGPQNRAGYTGLARLAESRGLGGPTRKFPVSFPIRSGVRPHSAPYKSQRVGAASWKAFEDDYYSRMVYLERPRADLADSSGVEHYEHS